ncbi:hypothetical protein [Terriglobus saanensis]|uniref:Uncharacterized protein n=1 Tax=Terriglobus saanensis (strain ATCC BAA-1853 / DSM 23119 / SP1PR4) TaxID=401053 RepID=E8UY13_TERSS|nr:hypothetical protein [Terriglobus saanensis]ADV84247.1 hypothetical protein AciPR4_3494 [Terriglobus saanensis SP1PR4]
MIRHIAARLALVALVSMPIVSNAAPLLLVSSDKVAHQKMVKITLKNGSTETRTVHVGEQTIVLQPNESTKLSTPAGTAVISVGEQGKHKDGETIFQVGESLNGAICTIS